jgi:hypothetical protein
MQPNVDDVTKHRERSAEVQKRHLLEQRPELLRSREDEDDQKTNAR